MLILLATTCAVQGKVTSAVFVQAIQRYRDTDLAVQFAATKHTYDTRSQMRARLALDAGVYGKALCRKVLVSAALCCCNAETLGLEGSRVQLQIQHMCLWYAAAAATAAAAAGNHAKAGQQSSFRPLLHIQLHLPCKSSAVAKCCSLRSRWHSQLLCCSTAWSMYGCSGKELLLC